MIKIVPIIISSIFFCNTVFALSNLDPNSDSNSDSNIQRNTDLQNIRSQPISVYKSGYNLKNELIDESTFWSQLQMRQIPLDPNESEFLDKIAETQSAEFKLTLTNFKKQHWIEVQNNFRVDKKRDAIASPSNISYWWAVPVVGVLTAMYLKDKTVTISF